MKTIKEIIDSLTDRGKYLRPLIEKLPRMDMNRAVQIVVYDIMAINSTNDLIHEIESRTYGSNKIGNIVVTIK